jgi:hypothetical protein
MAATVPRTETTKTAVRRALPVAVAVMPNKSISATHRTWNLKALPTCR